MSADTIQVLLETMYQNAKATGAATSEVFDGYDMVWLEATRAARTGRVYWTLNERRVAREDIPGLLLGA